MSQKPLQNTDLDTDPGVITSWKQEENNTQCILLLCRKSPEREEKAELYMFKFFSQSHP